MGDNGEVVDHVRGNAARCGAGRVAGIQHVGAGAAGQSPAKEVTGGIGARAGIPSQRHRVGTGSIGDGVLGNLEELGTRRNLNTGHQRRAPPQARPAALHANNKAEVSLREPYRPRGTCRPTELPGRRGRSRQYHSGLCSKPSAWPRRASDLTCARKAASRDPVPNLSRCVLKLYGRVPRPYRC
jgi:hypothetical protein